MIAALIRHGEYHQLADTPSAHQPFPLTPAGEAQAREAAQALRRIIDERGWRLRPLIDSSRMLRGWQTAQIIATQLSGFCDEPLQVESFDQLAERGMGCAANLTIARIEEILHRDPRFPDPPADWKANSHYRLPLQGAESLMDAGERVAGHLRRRAAVESGNNAMKLFIGHGAAFRHAAHYLGVLSFDDIARLSMYHGRPVFLESLGDGSWRQLAGEWKIRTGHREPMD